MNQHTWYEEYPFSDGLYVLNGFMYSMIGKVKFINFSHEQNRYFLRLHPNNRFIRPSIRRRSSSKIEN